jgi:hypothetical protein
VTPFHQVGLRQSVYEKLLAFAGNLQAATGRKVSMSDAVEHLITATEKES